MGFRLLRHALPALLLLVAADAGAVLRADYQFQGNLNSSVAGAPALANFGAGNAYASESINAGAATVLTFPAGGGVSLPTATTIIPAGVYSIAALVRLSDVSGYRKYVDFKNRTSDNGVYVFDGNLNFYNFATGAGAPIANNAWRTIVITRDAAGQVAGYVNGAPALGFADGSGAGVVDAANVLNFFFDDAVTSTEQSAGAVARIQVYDNALSATEVAGLGLGPAPALVPALDLRHLVALAGLLAVLGALSLQLGWVRPK
ncbi:MAG TPA: hypothetical protein PLI00_00440 [Pseudomonadota bacterium]|nr:hypothetical protein [Pseudomonadota bacterium]HQY35017.1 hypothetical protein [Pseudomonadota bacterium]HRA36180.1 hypothetical protein [Pseudomonadota bacterium]